MKIPSIPNDVGKIWVMALLTADDIALAPLITGVGVGIVVVVVEVGTYLPLTLQL